MNLYIENKLILVEDSSFKLEFDEKEEGIKIYFLNNIIVIVDLMGMFVYIRSE